MKLHKLLVTAFAIFVLTACTLSNEHWSNFDNQSTSVTTQENHAGLVFYRTDAGANPIAVNIKVNDESTSLVGMDEDSSAVLRR